MTIKPLLETLQLLGDGPLRKKYSEMVARQAALAGVMERLDQVEKRPEIEPEFYRYQAALVQEQIDQLKEEINQMSQQNPQIRKYAIEELIQELLAIEANTYAQFAWGDQLNDQLSPFLPEVLKDENESQ